MSKVLVAEILGLCSAVYVTRFRKCERRFVTEVDEAVLCVEARST